MKIWHRLSTFKAGENWTTQWSKNWRMYLRTETLKITKIKGSIGLLGIVQATAATILPQILVWTSLTLSRKRQYQLATNHLRSTVLTMGSSRILINSNSPCSRTLGPSPIFSSLLSQNQCFPKWTTLSFLRLLGSSLNIKRLLCLYNSQLLVVNSQSQISVLLSLRHSRQCLISKIQLKYPALTSNQISVRCHNLVNKLIQLLLQINLVRFNRATLNKPNKLRWARQVCRWCQTSRRCSWLAPLIISLHHKFHLDRILNSKLSPKYLDKISSNLLGRPNRPVLYLSRTTSQCRYRFFLDKVVHHFCRSKITSARVKSKKKLRRR